MNTGKPLPLILCALQKPVLQLDQAWTSACALHRVFTACTAKDAYSSCVVV